MAETVLQEFAQLVQSFCGLDYRKNIFLMQSKLQKRVAELNMTYRGYYDYLKMNPSEWTTVIELLTINETYFYREDNQLQLFQNVLLPEVKKRKMFEPIRIWSAACSSGEEPYTLAMLAMETGLVNEKQLHIYGTDINEKVLEKAKNGIYSKSSLTFRRCPEFLKEKYFHETEHNFTVKEHIKNMVTFQQLNLLDTASIQRLPKFDIIFCRNVLIYFDNETIQKIAVGFYNQLVDDGMLLLGHAESLAKIDVKFRLLSGESAFYYRKGE